MTKSKPGSSIKKQPQAYVNRPNVTPPLTPPAEEEEAFNKKLHGLKNAIRPSVFTRPSNDNIMNLIKVGGSHDAVLPLHLGDPGSSSNALPTQKQPEGHVMSAHNPPKNLWRIVTVCLWSITGGLSDAAPGELLPHIEEAYHISYAVVSMIWISNACGFIVLAIFSHKVKKLLGRNYSISVGCVFSVFMYALVSSGGPFPLIVSAFFFGGIGLALVLAQTNVFLAKLDKQSKYLAFFHGSYGIGATISPLIAATMVNHGIKWNYFYIILTILMAGNAVNSYFAFRDAESDLEHWYNDEEHEQLLVETESINVRQRDVQNSSDEEEGAIGLQDLGPHIVAPQEKDSSNELKLALRHPMTWLISFWVFFYQGGEVAMGGWIVTYLFDYRGAGKSYGYVASGFWGGLTLGRLVLTRPLHKYLGGRRSIVVVSSLAIFFVVMAWVIPNTILASVFISFAGTLIGPNYPLMITVATQGLIPRKIEVVALTISSSFGSSGGAILPFLVGMLAEKVGSFVVLPVFVASYSIMLMLWISLPNIERRKALGTQKLTLWQKFW